MVFLLYNITAETVCTGDFCITKDFKLKLDLLE